MYCIKLFSLILLQFSRINLYITRKVLQLEFKDRNIFQLKFIVLIQETMQCPSCFLRYSPTQRRPNIIPCGHTICLSCLRNSTNCRICNQPIDPNKIETINYSLMEIIQKDIKEIDKYVKVCFVGSSMTGKTSLIKRLMGNTFMDDTVTTIGYDFGFHDRLVDDLSVRYQLWDSAGQEKYRAISPIHYKNTDIVVIVYDVSQTQANNRLSYWIEQSLTNSPEDVKIMIAGNKLDLHYEDQSFKLFQDRSIQQIQTSGYPHMRISCKTGDGIREFWQSLDEELRKKLREKKKNSLVFQKQLQELEKRKDKMTKIKKNHSNGIGLKSRPHSNCC